MRTMFTKFLAFSSVALLMLASCKKDENRAIATSGTGGNLTASSTSPALDKNSLTTTAITFNVTQANFGFKAAATNTLQIDVPADNWAKPKEVILGAGVMSQSYTTLDFNNLLLALNLPTGKSAQVQARVKSQLSSATNPVYSNVINLTVTPFAITSWVYVPGAYQGWNPSTADSLVSATGNGIYKGTIMFTAGNLLFKITPAKNWNVAYGDAGNGTISTSGGNLTAPGVGSYLITADLNANTITYAYNQWGVIGDATPGGWSTDTDMKYNNSTGLWTVTLPLSSSGGYKFRYNHDWTVNLGGSGGTLTAGGANITVPVSGTYLVTLDPVANTYTAVKQ